MKHIMTEVANASADHRVATQGQKLDRMARMKLWSQYHDAAMSCLTAYESLMQARGHRAPTSTTPPSNPWQPSSPASQV